MGRALKYTEVSFYKKSLEYIHSISYERVVTGVGGEPQKNRLGEDALEVVFITPPNTADWALYLGVSKSTLTGTLRRRFSESYDMIKTVLEAYNVRELLGRRSGAEAVKFNLQNNFGWRDARSDEDASGVGAASQLSMSLSEKLSLIEELKRELREEVDGG